ERAGPEEARIEFAADREQCIANDLGRQAARRVPPDELVVAIEPAARWLFGRALLIDGAGENELMHRLEAPAVGDKLACQVIKQLRMGRSFTAHAEVAWRSDEAATEMMLPEPIDDDARQQIAGAL